MKSIVEQYLLVQIPNLPLLEPSKVKTLIKFSARTKRSIFKQDQIDNLVDCNGLLQYYIITNPYILYKLVL